MIENPVEGQHYWTVAESVETTYYSDSCRPQAPSRPWSGVLRKEERGGGTALLLHRECVGGKLNYDSNGCAIVEPADLFASEEGASKYYVELLQRYVNWLIRTTHEAVSELEAWRRR